MKKIYSLTAWHIESRYFIERSFFSNKKVAKESMFKLCNYLNYNHKLNVDNKDIVFDTEDLIRIHLDDTYNVSLTTFDIRKKVSTYL